MKRSADTREQMLIDTLTKELPLLRTRLNISQDELAKKTGLSRQTISSIETQKIRMSWSTFLALVLFFSVNEETDMMLLSYKGFLENLKSILHCTEASQIEI